MGARWLTTATFRGRRGTTFRATYEHPWPIRLTHWLIAIALLVMAGSGLQILRAFPAFGPKVPEHDIVNIPRVLALGGWLAGGLRWHLTFMWVFAGSGVLYLVAQVVTGRYRMVLFGRRDVPGVWPMVRYYFLFGPKPPLFEPYNPLQKLAYTTTVALGAASVLTGLVLYKPAQFSPLAAILGGYHMTRIWHFGAMCGLLAFVPGHLVMVAIHGWSNFAAMLTGWKRETAGLEAVAPGQEPVANTQETVAGRQEPMNGEESGVDGAPPETAPPEADAASSDPVAHTDGKGAQDA